MKYHGYAVEYEYSTWFKEKILKRIPELIEHNIGRDVIPTFKDDCEKAIFEACDWQDDGMCFERAVRLIRKDILSK